MKPICSLLGTTSVTLVSTVQTLSDRPLHRPTTHIRWAKHVSAETQEPQDAKGLADEWVECNFQITGRAARRCRLFLRHCCKWSEQPWAPVCGYGALQQKLVHVRSTALPVAVQSIHLDCCNGRVRPCTTAQAVAARSLNPDNQRAAAWYPMQSLKYISKHHPKLQKWPGHSARCMLRAMRGPGR